VELPVHQGHLKLVFEITYGAQAAHDDGGSNPLGELREQTIERLERDTRVTAHRGSQHLQSFFDREERLFARIRGDGDDKLIGQAEASANQVLVAPGRWIERSGINRNASHGAWQKVIAVSP
jgi:hypothetical protein